MTATPAAVAAAPASATPVAAKVAAVVAAVPKTSFISNVVAEVKALELDLANAWKTHQVIVVAVLAFVAGFIVKWVL